MIKLPSFAAILGLGLLNALNNPLLLKIDKTRCLFILNCEPLF